MRICLPFSALAFVAIAVAVFGWYVPAAEADSTFKPTTAVRFCNALDSGFTDPSLAGSPSCVENLATGVEPNITTTLDLPGTDLNVSTVVTLTPNNEPIASGTSMPVGTKIGGVHSQHFVGLFGNGSCNILVPMDYVLFNVALPDNPGNPRASANIAYPLPQGTLDRFRRWKVGSVPDPNNPLDGSVVTHTAITTLADSTNKAIQNYPSYLLDAFDPDFVPGGADGPASPLVPLAVYGALSLRADEWLPLYIVQFASGALATLPEPLASINASMGQPAVTVQDDPTAITRAANPVSDACTPRNDTTLLLGKPSGNVRITSPGSVSTVFFLQYLASLRDTDQDSYENAIDTCPVSVNVGDPKVTPGSGDANGDGIDSSCEVTPTPSPPVSTPDADADGYMNRDDNCPYAPNGVPTPTAGPVAQKDSEIATPAPDKGPRTDEIGDACDSEAGTKSFIQNCNLPCPTPNWVTITMSDTVANGRYMSVTVVVPKCIGGTDADADGYCSAQDTSGDSGVCATQSPPSCTTRHSQWSGATHPALQMDTDGDKQSDALETYVGTDPVQSCSQTSVGNNNEPMDNWMFDLNDNQAVNGQDSGPFGGAGGSFGSNVVNGPFGASPPRPGVRFDFNVDGVINGQDTGKFGGVGPYTGGTGPFNKTCATAGIPVFSQQ